MPDPDSPDQRFLPRRSLVTANLARPIDRPGTGAGLLVFLVSVGFIGPRLFPPSPLPPFHRSIPATKRKLGPVLSAGAKSILFVLILSFPPTAMPRRSNPTRPRQERTRRCSRRPLHQSAHRPQRRQCPRRQYRRPRNCSRLVSLHRRAREHCSRQPKSRITMRRRPRHFPVKRPTGSFVNSEPSSISKSSRIPVSQRRLRRPLRPACAAVNPLNTVSEPTPMLAGLASERSAGQSKIRRCIETVSRPSTPATQNADRLGRGAGSTARPGRPRRGWKARTSASGRISSR
jgi:hypothetical protein